MRVLHILAVEGLPTSLGLHPKDCCFASGIVSNLKAAKLVCCWIYFDFAIHSVKLATVLIRRESFPWIVLGRSDWLLWITLTFDLSISEKSVLILASAWYLLPWEMREPIIWTFTPLAYWHAWLRNSKHYFGANMSFPWLCKNVATFSIDQGHRCSWFPL